MNATYDDFTKLEFRAATVTAAERVEGSEKLIRLQLDLGELGPRQIVAGIGKAYESAALVGTQIIVVANLEPRTLMGHESNGMLLAARDADGLPVLVRPEKPVPAGSKIN
ncbi:MAG TPA: methionine--tRNA ligase [Candidatus Paceibacterota bacterium]|nr:methionine--tRNA ligase [Candidatus Paceibacterota bacterium]